VDGSVYQWSRRYRRRQAHANNVSSLTQTMFF